ncbi:MAG: hypothetical protein LBI02_10260 [Opitutaceae bacterium]|nr:hypothetical protein [Opitutaceae bacterium]
MRAARRIEPGARASAGRIGFPDDVLSWKNPPPAAARATVSEARLLLP